MTDREIAQAIRRADADTIALDLAIKALEQEPCEDTISRQAAIDALKREEALTRAFGYHVVIDTIRELPSAQPQLPEWAKKVEEYRQSAPQHIHNPLAWTLYQV